MLILDQDQIVSYDDFDFSILISLPWMLTNRIQSAYTKQNSLGKSTKGKNSSGIYPQEQRRILEEGDFYVHEVMGNQNSQVWVWVCAPHQSASKNRWMEVIPNNTKHMIGNLKYVVNFRKSGAPSWILVESSQTNKTRVEKMKQEKDV